LIANAPTSAGLRTGRHRPARRDRQRHRPPAQLQRTGAERPPGGAIAAGSLQRPLAVGNDCQCFALSEAQGGAADGVPTMFGAIIGTGAGGGYCVNGRLLRGSNGVAGEWGHWPLAAALLQPTACRCSTARADGAAAWSAMSPAPA
jgi:hypothetical protein